MIVLQRLSIWPFAAIIVYVAAKIISKLQSEWLLRSVRLPPPDQDPEYTAVVEHQRMMQELHMQHVQESGAWLAEFERQTGKRVLEGEAVTEAEYLARQRRAPDVNLAQALAYQAANDREYLARQQAPQQQMQQQSSPYGVPPHFYKSLQKALGIQLPKDLS